MNNIFIIRQNIINQIKFYFNECNPDKYGDFELEQINIKSRISVTNEYFEY